MAGFRLNQEFFENVRVPKECLIGEENRGAEYLFMQLAHERIALVPHSFSLRSLGGVAQWAKATRLNGAPVLEQPWVRNKLVDLALEMEVLKLLNYRVSWMIARGVVPIVESSMIKVFGSEHTRRATDACLQIMGLYGQLQTGSKWVPLRGRPEHVYRMDVLLTFGGGTNEVLRDMMAMMGLSLPRSR
jgi:alkylation response protein AidB-like acyl-CoA dehydrogenase